MFDACAGLAVKLVVELRLNNRQRGDDAGDASGDASGPIPVGLLENKVHTIDSVARSTNGAGS